MLKVGITGGIGAGKSIVCRVFKTLGIPVFDADAAAKHLMENDAALIKSVSGLFGSDIYKSGRLDREQLAATVFNQPALLQQLNAIVHPVTISYGNAWMASQTATYVIKEAAIFFESGSYKEMDVMIGVFAPVELRLKRVVTRPGMTREKAPTGSGKSTTLYSCLNKLNAGDKNITTCEDPVEYQIQGINQVQTNNKAGLTFASALKSFLRQDPDIIMVGEIRDGETAKIAVEAALTGHLVLSTLHTNDSTGAISRLVEMKVEPFLVASALIGVLAQRLARCICPNCKESFTPPVEAVRKFGMAMFGDSDIQFYKGRGCDHCKMTGYRGRSGIHEVFQPSDRTRQLILNRSSGTEIRQAAVEEGMKTMQDDGLRKTLNGVTTMEECLRVVYIEGGE